MINILSVDVEEWFHPEALQHLFPAPSWSEQGSRVEQNVSLLLDLFSQKEVKATFFILGWIAQKHPHMIRDIVSRGHEIASHGNSHRMVTKLTADDFRQDLAQSIKLLEDISGQKVSGYRAPTFSVVEGTLWAWEIMLDLGLEYDSSVYPIWHDRYGIPAAPRSVYTALEKNGKKLIEFPMPTLRILRKNIPFGGGGYLRMFPLWFTRYAIKRFNQEGFPVIIYMHPWEFDIHQPKLNLGLIQTQRHYLNIDKNYSKLAKLLENFQWTSFKEYMDHPR